MSDSPRPIESSQDGKPLSIGYAAAPQSVWKPSSVGKRLGLGIIYCSVYWVLVFGAALVADFTHSFIPFVIVLFPWGLLRVWLYPDDETWFTALLGNAIFWGFGLAFILHRRFRRAGRQGRPPHD